MPADRRCAHNLGTTTNPFRTCRCSVFGGHVSPHGNVVDQRCCCAGHMCNSSCVLIRAICADPVCATVCRGTSDSALEVDKISSFPDVSASPAQPVRRARNVNMQATCGATKCRAGCHLTGQMWASVPHAPPISLRMRRGYGHIVVSNLVATHSMRIHAARRSAAMGYCLIGHGYNLGFRRVILTCNDRCSCATHGP